MFTNLFLRINVINNKYRERSQAETVDKRQVGVLRFFNIPIQPAGSVFDWVAQQSAASLVGIMPTSFFPVRRQVASAVVTEQTKEQSEDYLYLNIWTRDVTESAKQPVIFWIHDGSGSDYDGTAFARKGVTLVTLNYRLGEFGFMVNPNSDINFGIEDIIAGLIWIKTNITGFGGDATKVTIFSQPVGAVAIRSLLSCPSARELFQRVVICRVGEASGLIN